MTPCGPNDTQLLLSAARQGNLAAQSELLNTYDSYLRLLARLQIDQQFQGRVSPSDVVQEVFLRASQRFGDFRGTTEKELVAWLRSILASQLISFARHNLAGRRDVRRDVVPLIGIEQSSVAMADCYAAHSDSPSGHAARGEEALLLIEALDRLPPDYREVIVLRHLEDIPFSQIAARMSRTIPSVKSLWMRAVGKLRSHMSEHAP